MSATSAGRTASAPRLKSTCATMPAQKRSLLRRATDCAIPASATRVVAGSLSFGSDHPHSMYTVLTTLCARLRRFPEPVCGRFSMSRRSSVTM